MRRLLPVLDIVFFLTLGFGCTRSQQTRNDGSQLANAVGLDDLQQAKKLLRLGADPNERSENGVTPLWIAVDHDDTTMVNLLLEHHADIHDTSGRHSMESVGEIAAFNNSFRSLEILFKHGFSLQKKDKEGQSMLHIATRRNNLEIAKFLLQHGLDPNTPDSLDGQSPLLIAVDNGSPAMVSLLLSHGANPNSRGPASFTPLCEVILQDADESFQRPAVFEELRMFGDSSKRSRHERYVKIIMTLLDSGALPNFEIARGAPLWTAAWKCDPEMATILIQYGADRVAKDRDGNTPLDMAKKIGCKEMVELLTK